MFLKHKEAQSTLEYVMLISAIVVGLVAMANYSKRSLQGRFKESADDLGSQFVPGQVEYNWTTSSRSARQEKTEIVGLGESATLTQSSNVFAIGDFDKGETQATWGSEKITPEAGAYDK